ncbi:MAG: cell division protein FtsZ [Hyphomicrobiales bacterium]|nr:MAG: cell division protein FtsZ [Hyphomicrobiales bacterium]
MRILEYAGAAGQVEEFEMKPRIQVIGVGGAGGNAVNNMIAAGLKGPEFIVANTDAQALAASTAEKRIQLGASLTEGLGAGSKPEIGEAAAEEAIEEIRAAVKGAHMVFVAAGMGGGTGTGAASVIARIAREFGILTVAVVTKPFTFEGSRRMRVAEAGIAELKRHVDTLLVIPNQNLFRLATDRTTFTEAFLLADQVLYSGIACIVDLIVKEGLINLDLADVRTVLTGMGTAMMGTGEASGDQRAIYAAEEAIVNPLLDEVTLKGARSLLLSITGGPDLTLWEVDEVANRVRQEVDPEANIIVGATFDDSLGDRVRVSIVASGMARAGVQPPGLPPPHDLQNRIAQAMTPGGQPPPVPRQGGQGHAPNQRSATAGWQAPGGVYIHEAPPQLGPHDPGMAAPNRATVDQQPDPRQRRLPPLPDVASSMLKSAREYWGGGTSEPKMEAEPAYPAASIEPAEPAGRSSLLRRLASAGKVRLGPASHVPPPEQRAPEEFGAEVPERPVELPVFFGRSKGGQR